MKTVCVLIVSWPSIDHLTPPPSLTFLPLHCRYAGHLTIKMFYKYLLSDTHPPLLNCRPVGQMSI